MSVATYLLEATDITNDYQDVNLGLGSALAVDCYIYLTNTCQYTIFFTATGDYEGDYIPVPMGQTSGRVHIPGTTGGGTGTVRVTTNVTGPSGTASLLITTLS